MARCNHLPREGHMQTMFRIFGYLKNHDKGSTRFNLDVPETHMILKVQHNWSELYPVVEEEIPPNRPEPKGRGF